MSKKIICTKEAPVAVGPYSQAVEAGGFVFVSGQLGLVPETGKLAEGGAAEQAGQALDNLEAILTAAGSGMDRVVKTTVLLVDIADFPTVNDVYKDRFETEPPARATFAVSALPLGGLVEIEAIALSD